jgi:hypothetical protein
MTLCYISNPRKTKTSRTQNKQKERNNKKRGPKLMK